MFIKGLKKYWLLIAAMILFIIAGLNYFLFEKNEPVASEQQYIDKVKTKIAADIKASDIEINEIGLKVQKSKYQQFADLNLKTSFPYYIFKNGKLNYWSDFRYVPDYLKIKGDYKTGILWTSDKMCILRQLKLNKGNDNFEIYSLIPIYRKYKNENEYLKSGFNESIFNTNPDRLNIKPNEKKYLNVSSPEGDFLFSVIPPTKEKIVSPIFPKYTLYILAMALFFLSLFVFNLIYLWCKTYKFGQAFFLLLGFGLVIRWIMLSNSMPFLFSDSELFNPKYFSINRFTPTLGDLIINLFFILMILIFSSIFFYRTKLFYKLLNAKPFVKSFQSVLMVLLSVVTSFLCILILNSIYEKSNFQLSYSLGISYDLLKTGSILAYLILATIFFLANHIFSTIFLRINKNKKTGFFHWLYGTLLSIIFLIFINEFSWVYLIGCLYFLIIYYFSLSKYFYIFRYNTSLYFFLGALTFAIIGVKISHDQNVKKNLIDKMAFGERYLAENDLLGEGLLEKASSSISKDTSIIVALNREILSNEAVKEIVISRHLDIYFDRYDTEILSFDNAGNSLDKTEGAKNLTQYETLFIKDKYKTSNPELFFVNETGNNFIKQYVLFVPIVANDIKKGTIIIDLKLRDSFSESVYPELLMDKKFFQNPESKNYSYGIFDNNNKLIFSNGSFNYLKGFKPVSKSNSEIFKSSINLKGYNHFGIKGLNNRYIVVSSQENFWKALLSDFSFLFLLSVLVISTIIGFYGLRYGLNKLNMNFSTKIQLYLNAAFLLPLILVIVITLTVIKTTLLRIQEKTFTDNTKNIASTIQIHLENFNNNKMSKAFLEQEITDLAQDTKVDINLYNNKGILQYSTRPLVYQYNLLSPYINPLAYNKIIQDRENETLLNESLGSLNYKTVYMNLKNSENKSLGVVGIPYFDAKLSLDRQVIEVVTSILSVFILLFFLLLVLSYFASNQLTHPLKLIAQKIKRTNLDKLNEPLEWKTDDEIGTLTKSYNKMLLQLEESKVALTQSEKQTAWREMAKQVAHEIKNPLTPMKLSIQQLQRTLPTDDPKSRDRIERALNSLTEQIDNISEIANSFSEFAKMPVPRNESFDLVPVVQKTADLYAQNNNVKINVNLKDAKSMVKGDRQLVSRVITNLIINGIQSVPPSRLPQIDIRLYKNEEENFAIIEVKDNGSGIPENIRKKVFIPNFSTKVGGSGLGLAMAKRGIEHAGGNIWFETTDDQGTTFYVDLPMSKS